MAKTKKSKAVTTLKPDGFFALFQSVFNDKSPYDSENKDPGKAYGKIIPVALFLFLLIINIHMLCPNVPAGDGGELIAAATTGGIAHPPGYPLYTMIGKLFSFIPMSNIAWRLNLLSAVLNSASAVFVYLILYSITMMLLPSLIGALFLSFSAVFWKYSHVAEVFPLNNLFVAVLIYVLILWSKNTSVSSKKGKEETNESSSSWILYSWAFLFGLSLTNHLTIIFVFPAFIYFIFSQQRSVFRPSVLFRGFVFFLLGLLPYVYLPVAASFKPYLNWDNCETFSGFIRIITRGDYGTFILSPTGINQSSPVFQMPIYLKSLLNEFSVAGFVLGLLGMWRLYRKNAMLFIFFASGFILSGIIFLMVGNMDINKPSFYAVNSRFHMMPGIFFALFIGFGVEMLFAALDIFLKNNALSMRMAGFFVLLLPFVLAVLNYNKADQRWNTLPYEYGKNALLGLPQNAVLIATGDTYLGVIDYLHLTLGMRPDIKIVEEKVKYSWYVKQVRKRIPDLNIPFDHVNMKDHFISDIIESNISKFAIFVHHSSDYTIPQKFSIVPLGLNNQIFPKDRPVDIEEYKKSNISTMKDYKIDTELLKKVSNMDFEGELIYSYSEMYYFTGMYLFSLKDYIGSEVALQKAVSINPSCAPAFKGIGVLYAYHLKRSDSSKKAVENWIRFLKLFPNDPEKEKIEKEIRRLSNNISK